VGYSCEVKIGEKIEKGQTLGTIFCRNAAQADRIKDKLQAAHLIADEQPAESSLIRAVIS